MKRYTQSELQKMYIEPSEELKDRIHQEISSLPIKEQEEKIVKKKLSFSFVTVIAILLALVAVAYAATEVYHQIIVNWKGEIVEEHTEPIMPEATTPPTQPMSDAELSRMASELLSNSPAEDEYVIVSYMTSYGTGGSARPIRKKYDSWDEFQNAMKEADHLTLPCWIPEGYEFESAEVRIGCKEQGEYKLIEERQEGALTLFRYKIDDTCAIIVGYEIVFRESAEDYHYIHINSMLSDDDQDSQQFFLSDGDNASVVTIPGMDNALTISSDNNPKMSSLVMRRILSNPLKCKNEPMLEKAQMINDIRIYTEEQIDIFGPLLDVETLQKIFTHE